MELRRSPLLALAPCCYIAQVEVGRIGRLSLALEMNGSQNAENTNAASNTYSETVYLLFKLQHKI